MLRYQKVSVKMPGMPGEGRVERGAVQCVWSIDVSRIIHEAGGASNGQGLVGLLLLSVGAQNAYT